jgi:hypothetical protein
MLQRAVLLVMICGSAAACAQQRERVGDDARAACSLPVIVAFAGQPDAALLADLGSSVGVRLDAPTALTANLYSVTLGADGSADACLAAAERLRKDPRVRAVTVDERRAIHAAQ